MENEEIKEDIVEYCVNCNGLKPCWCDKPHYIKTWRFVYELMMSCKPSI